MKIERIVNIVNRRARFEYEILEEYEAGIVLYGTEIKSLRSSKASIAESFCQMKDGELWVVNMMIDEYKMGSFYNHKAKRDRKLLLHKGELSRLEKKTTSNPWLIGVGAHGENHKAQADNFSNNLSAKNFNKRLFNLNNYSITPPLSKLTVARNINNILVLDLQASVGISRSSSFKFNSLWNEESWFDPYARVGANYLRHDYSSWTPGYDWRGAYNYTTFNGTDVTGKKDFFAVSTDKDDRCPETPGLPEFQGCPDTDGDGIPDIDDKCPDVAGPKENQDVLETHEGLAQFQGCPDTDGDGIPDIDDKCPTEAGPKENQGCLGQRKSVHKH
ncbi:hypothetical protein FQR65_LT16221 [Abscondita terminalis]|nr:hypothetical protein FQR65_LT16221 [Abscondita terminalis]